MERKHRITLLTPPLAQDSAGESLDNYTEFRTMWAERTEFGGRENLYASRIVQQNEVVYSILWVDGVTPAMRVREGDSEYNISTVAEQGFRKLLHIRAQKSDVND